MLNIGHTATHDDCTFIIVLENILFCAFYFILSAIDTVVICIDLFDSISHCTITVASVHYENVSPVFPETTAVTSDLLKDPLIERNFVINNIKIVFIVNLIDPCRL